MVCPECQQKCESTGPCECSVVCCDHCRHHGEHKTHWLLHDEWARRARKLMLLARKPGTQLAVHHTKDGLILNKSMGGRPQKQYSPISCRDLNKFLSGIAGVQQRSTISHKPRSIELL